MASSFIGKITKFARSPKGQQLIRQAGTKAQHMAKDPKTKAKIDQVRGRIGNRRQPPPAH